MVSDPDLTKTIQVIGDLHAGAITAEKITAMDSDADTVGAALRTIQVGDTTDEGTGAQDTTALNFLNGLPNDWSAISGNHDITESRTADQFAVTYGSATKNFVVDVGAFVAVCLGYPVNSATITWLDTQLTIYADRICIIFSHEPLYNTTSGSDVAGFFISNSANVVATLAGHPNAKAFVTGHTHTEITDDVCVLKRCGSHDVLCVAASTPHYTLPDNQTDFYTVYLSVFSNKLEVRFRCFTTPGWDATMYTVS